MSTLLPPQSWASSSVGVLVGDGDFKENLGRGLPSGWVMVTPVLTSEPVPGRMHGWVANCRWSDLRKDNLNMRRRLPDLSIRFGGIVDGRCRPLFVGTSKSLLTIVYHLKQR